MPLAASVARPVHPFPLLKSAAVKSLASSRVLTRAVDEEFQVDREKAREALQKLDLQLQSLKANEPIRKPNPSQPFSVSAAFDSSADMRGKEMPDIPGSAIAYAAVALLALTFINNLIFILLIKPSVDGKEAPQTILSKVRSIPATETLQIAPTLSNMQ